MLILLRGFGLSKLDAEGRFRFLLFDVATELCELNLLLEDSFDLLHFLLFSLSLFSLALCILLDLKSRLIIVIKILLPLCEECSLKPEPVLLSHRLVLGIVGNFVMGEDRLGLRKEEGRFLLNLAPEPVFFDLVNPSLFRRQLCLLLDHSWRLHLFLVFNQDLLCPNFFVFVSFEHILELFFGLLLALLAFNINVVPVSEWEVLFDSFIVDFLLQCFDLVAGHEDFFGFDLLSQDFVGLFLH